MLKFIGHGKCEPILLLFSENNKNEKIDNVPGLIINAVNSSGRKLMHLTFYFIN